MAADPAWRRRVLEAPRVERVEALGEYGITLKVLGMVRATEQPAASGELRRRLLVAFAANGIEIPQAAARGARAQHRPRPVPGGRHDPPGPDAGGAVGRRGLSGASRVAPPIRHPAPAARSGRPRRVEWPDPRDDPEEVVSAEPQAQGGPEIENLLAERRTFPPDPAFVAQANATAALYEAAEADYVGFWATQARERLSWTQPVRRDARVGPAVREVVQRRRAERRLQLRRPPRRARASATGSPTTGSASPARPARSPTTTCCARRRRRRTRCSSWACARATGSRSTCR